MPMKLALHGDLLDFDATPGWGDTSLHGVRWRPDHWLLIDDGRIAGTLPGREPPGPDWQREEHSGRLLMPGFVDTHVHCPQLDVIASCGTELLRLAGHLHLPGRAALRRPRGRRRRRRRCFLDALLAHGTTAARGLPDRARGVGRRAVRGRRARAACGWSPARC
ncbi:MAG: hypothetical protein MZW92_23280 [Comamonadaceae bacterium]|nr:hypothetical protein [Comamonadaceae bacterium]